MRRSICLMRDCCKNMNTVFYFGKIKKKYSPSDFQNAVKSFADKHGLNVQCPDENTTNVDFGVKSEGFAFIIENGCLKKQTVKHETDENGKYLLIYELLYSLRTFFTAFEVFDDFGIWADICYKHEPVQITLRQLTDNEKQMDEHLDLSRCTDSCQILLGIIEMFIWDKGDSKDKVIGDWNTMIQKIRDKNRRAAPLWLYGLVKAWIYFCMDFKGKPVSALPENDKKLSAAVTAAEFGLTANIMHCWGGITGKLEKDITVFFKYEDQKNKRENGCGLDESFEGVYRYVLSSLEYLGFTIKAEPNYPPNKLDVSCFDYYSLV